MYEDIVSLFPGLLHRHIQRLTIRGERARGQCPFHEGKNPFSFSAHLTKGVWSCWSCGKSGNVHAFALWVGEPLSGYSRSSAPKLHTMSESLQRKANADYSDWKREKYLDIVQQLGETKDFDEETRLINLLDRYDINPTADDHIAKDEYVALVGKEE